MTAVEGRRAHASAAAAPPRRVGRFGPTRPTRRSSSTPASCTPRQRVPSAWEASGPARYVIEVWPSSTRCSAAFFTARTLSLTTDVTDRTERFSTTTGLRLATARISWSLSREDARTNPSTVASSRASALASARSDSCVSTTASVRSCVTAARSAPRTMPTKTGLPMSATTRARTPDPREDSGTCMREDR